MFHYSAFVSLKVRAISVVVPFLLWRSACIKFSTRADILSYKIIMVTDITILFSDLVSLIVPLQTWNVKYYKYAIIKNGLKSLVLKQVTRCKIGQLGCKLVARPSFPRRLSIRDRK